MKRKEVRGYIGGCACLSVLLLLSATPALGQDTCATRVAAVCNGAGGVVDPCADGTPTGPLGSCTTGGGVLDSWIEFVATNTAARLRTDLSSVGTDSNFVMYQVDQANPCNQAAWVEVCCSEDECNDDPASCVPGASPWLGHALCGKLTVGNTYIVQLGAWGDNCPTPGDPPAPYTLDVACFDPPPEDQCEGAIEAVCNGAGATADPCDGTEGPDDPDMSCASGGGVLSVYAKFVATDVNARIRTDLSSAGTDSDYAVYQVDQATPCDETQWVEIGCSEDEGAGFNGDISVPGLIVGDVYIVQLGSWGDSCSGGYTVDVICPTDLPGAVCGDGIVSPFGDEDCDGDDDDNCQVPGTCFPPGDPNECMCPPPKVPALPVWGLIALGLMLFAGAAVVFGRSRTFTAPSGE